MFISNASEITATIQYQFYTFALLFHLLWFKKPSYIELACYKVVSLALEDHFPIDSDILYV